MILFPAPLITIMSGQATDSFYLIYISPDIYKTSFHRDVTFNGHTYVADGSIESVDPPQLSSVVDKQPFKFTFADTLLEFGPILSDTYIGRDVEVTIVFIDPATGLPELNPANTVQVYGGKIDGIGYSISTAIKGSSSFPITCTSPMGDLDLTRTFYASQDFLDKNYPGDNSYEQIYQGSGQLSLKWGKP